MTGPTFYIRERESDGWLAGPIQVTRHPRSANDDATAAYVTRRSGLAAGCQTPLSIHSVCLRRGNYGCNAPWPNPQGKGCVIDSRKLHSNNLSGNRKPVLKAQSDTVLAGPSHALPPCFLLSCDTEADIALLPRFLLPLLRLTRCS